ncbi:type VII toxin-antitoxin system MntA family adenylyltransferase antitoxin [Desulfosporosinus sp. BICA1-9]|uniref:type VII toxin-antitoxin system MntA family adenylyltransferase antitoxin n=1 Tax=Desulfosporosinus sp. BICA1-9 TaxID=1531958 RepID=UPI00054B7B75|nr:nucleotidyltransferase domain-containing protein [Desulfosporosinus sp. BICA1-9]KJS47446.1 MAG: DNA polymerase III subunit beta [Peptococcaceae bacterium BRH_c23]KJS89050.1 MAG: DNA polymerase III subunit beta [Desulfosporosinus sp. BICA1-9]HBW37452.1 nucleotidyltransferase domain-containing protein [Desulfosporosinus sp.]
MRKLPVELQSWKEFFQARVEIAAVYLFGSLGTEFEHPQSDIDLGVIFNRPVTLSEELELDGALSLHVGHDGIDLVNLNRVSIALQFRALQEGILVYEGDYIEHSDFIECVIKTYPDYAVKYAIFSRDYELALKEEYSHGG